MRKEALMNKKKEVANQATWYVKNVLTEEDLKKFSVPQLIALNEIFARAENFRESSDPFIALSATEVLQKASGKIAEFSEEGIREEPREEVLTGAAANIYREYEKSNQ